LDKANNRSSPELDADGARRVDAMVPIRAR